MAEEVQQHHVDTCLPTISFDMKDVFPEIEPYLPTSNPTTRNVDSVVGGLLSLDVAEPQEAIILNQNISEIDGLLSFLASPKPSVSTFSILPSKKERGKPYFIDDQERILTTKKNEPIHLQLDTCKPGYKILLTLRYFDQDYYDRPMTCSECSHAYKSCPSSEDHNGANFCVKSRDGTVEYLKLLEGNAFHPTAMITVTAKHKDVDIYAAFKCRNSCSEHKKYGGDRTLRLMLLDDQEHELCCNEWRLRVCESAKRDHNLVLTKIGSGRGSASTSSVFSDPRQPIVEPASVHFAPAPVLASDAESRPPPMKRVKMEEETVIHFINAATSSTQEVPSGRPVFRCLSSSPAATHSSQAGSFRKNSKITSFVMGSNSTSGVGNVPSCFEAKPLLPIAPPASAFAETPPAEGVVPVVVYPKSEADKKLLRNLAVRLNMDIYDVRT